MILYHATNEEGFLGIISSGCINPGIDKIVYLADSPNNAVKFMSVRVPMSEPIYVFQVELPDSKVFETFDHSYSFFKCKSYGYKGIIDQGLLDNCWKYPAPGGI